MKRGLWILLIVLISVPLTLAQEPQPKPEPKPAAKPEEATPATKPQEATPAAKPEGTTPAAPLPTVDQVLDKCVEALGGKPALEKLNSRESKGTFDMPTMGATGTVTMLAKAPDKQIMIIDIPGFGLVQRSYDGKIGWAQDPMSGMRDMTGGELAAQKRSAVFHHDIMMKELYPKMEVKNKEKLGDKDAYVVEATPTEGSPVKMFFDVQSGLLVRFDADGDSPQGTVHVETSLEDYKELDGVKVPFTIKTVMPEMTFVVKFSEVKHNVEIEDSKFAKPSGQ